MCTTGGRVSLSPLGRGSNHDPQGKNPAGGCQKKRRSGSFPHQIDFTWRMKKQVAEIAGVPEEELPFLLDTHQKVRRDETRGVDYELFGVGWDIVRSEGYLLDEITEYQIAVAQSLIRLGVDGLYTGDDDGSQRDLLVSRKDLAEPD